MNPTQIEAAADEIFREQTGNRKIIAAIIAKHAGGAGVTVHRGQPYEIVNTLSGWTAWTLHRSCFLGKDGAWKIQAFADGGEQYFGATREAAEAFLAQHADQPTK